MRSDEVNDNCTLAEMELRSDEVNDGLAIFGSADWMPEITPFPPVAAFSIMDVGSLPLSKRACRNNGIYLAVIF
jgi:hypothetical protein